MTSPSASSNRPSGAQITTAVTTTVGMSLTLLLIGLLLVIGFLGHHWEQELRQEARVQVFFQRDVDSNSIGSRRAKPCEQTRALSPLTYIDAQTASRELEAQLGESFVDFLGYVPLSDVMDLRMLPSASTTEALAIAVQRLEEIPGVADVVWQEALLGQIERTIQRLVGPLIGLAGIFLLAAVALMNNTIRLTVFARRFLIKTMQLVGAHPQAIRAPFLRQGFYYGIVSGALAFAAINGILTLVQFQNTSFLDPFSPLILGVLLGILLFLGVLFGVSSTAFAVNRFLKKRLDTLH